MNAAAVLTRDPRRLAALCELWRGAGREVWVTIQGRSMTPGIPPGSRLLLRCGPVEPRPGDILAYRREGVLLVHRVVRVEDGFLVLKGDANPDLDDPVPPEDVLGTVVAVRRPPAVKRAWWALRSRLRRRARGARP